MHLIDNEPFIQPTRPVTVLLSQDNHKPIGRADVLIKDGKTYADFTFINGFNPSGLYPSVAYRDGKIYAIGLHPEKNIDESILPL